MSNRASGNDIPEGSGGEEPPEDLTSPLGSVIIGVTTHRQGGLGVTIKLQNVPYKS